jgi:hypothetical protein
METNTMTRFCSNSFAQGHAEGSKPAHPQLAVILLLLTISILSACSSPSPQPALSGAAFQDDFSNQNCLFGKLQAGSTQGYECTDGEFRAWINNNQAAYDLVTASSSESYGNVQVEVDVRFVSGEEAGAYIICRGSQLKGNFYFLRISADGLAEITDYLDGEEQIARMYPLSEGTIQPGWNHLRADCIGKNLSLYLNGELLLEREFDASYYPNGEIGLGAGGGSLGFSEVRFDNLQVTQP